MAISIQPDGGEGLAKHKGVIARLPREVCALSFETEVVGGHVAAAPPRSVIKRRASFDPLALSVIPTGHADAFSAFFLL